jgi:hypothetical protein
MTSLTLTRTLTTALPILISAAFDRAGTRFLEFFATARNYVAGGLKLRRR